MNRMVFILVLGYIQDFPYATPVAKGGPVRVTSKQCQSACVKQSWRLLREPLFPSIPAMAVRLIISGNMEFGNYFITYAAPKSASGRKVILH